MMKALCAALLFVSSLAWAEPIKISSKDIPFAPFENDAVKLLSVVELRSQDENFGGISGLMHKGNDLIAVTDRGYMLRFANGVLESPDLITLKTAKGKQLKGKKKTDAESMTLAKDGRILVSFERNHRVNAFDDRGRMNGVQPDLPEAIKNLPDNNGLEAIETLSDGRLILLAEGGKGNDSAPLWMQTPNGWNTFEIPLSDGFRPTGLARLPNEERLVLLERFYEPLRGNRTRLSFLNVDNMTRTQAFAEIGTPIPVDNFEAIALKRDSDRQTIITLLSDDNFSILQRTLLMRLLLKKKESQ